MSDILAAFTTAFSGFLCKNSYKLVFDFTTDAGELEYLNGKEFKIDDIWFKDEFYAGTLNKEKN